MFIVVAYDIADDKRRREVYKVLKDFGTARQESLFECQLDFDRITTLKRTVRQLIELPEDGVRFYSICAKCEKKLPTGKVALGGKEPVIV
jgi:CRISPR-associated protein Cas2